MDHSVRVLSKPRHMPRRLIALHLVPRSMRLSSGRQRVGASGSDDGSREHQRRDRQQPDFRYLRLIIGCEARRDVQHNRCVADHQQPSPGYEFHH